MATPRNWASRKTGQRLARGNHAALHYARIPDFMERLRERGEKEIATRALEFAVLTAARSGEVFGMTFERSTGMDDYGSPQGRA